MVRISTTPPSEAPTDPRICQVCKRAEVITAMTILAPAGYFDWLDAPDVSHFYIDMCVIEDLTVGSRIVSCRGPVDPERVLCHIEAALVDHEGSTLPEDLEIADSI